MAAIMTRRKVAFLSPIQAVPGLPSVAQGPTLRRRRVKFRDWGLAITPRLQKDRLNVAFWAAAIGVSIVVAGCSWPQRTKHSPRPAPAASQAGPPPNVSSCREYADHTAARQMQREFDVMSGNFRGGESRVFKDFARADAQRYRQQLYEACLNRQRAAPAQK